MSKRKKKRLVTRPKDTYKKESKVIRVSPELDKLLKGIGHRGESYDNIIRRIMGLPVNKYADETAGTCYAVLNEREPHLFEDLAEAKGAAVRLAVKHGLKSPFNITKLKSTPA